MPQFWQDLSDSLFNNVERLHEQVMAFNTTKAADVGFPSEIVRHGPF